MRKLISVLLILLILCGCHGGKVSDSFVVPDTFDENKSYEITFWAKNDTNINQVNVYKKAIEDFESLYPNIKVNMTLYTDYSRIYNDVITNISTDTTPNVCITYPDHIATYLTGNNVVVPLDDLYTDDKYGLGGSELRFESPSIDEIVDKFVEEGKIGDNYYALPFIRSTEVCYVNKTYVEKMGYELPEKLTWDFIYEVSKKAMEKDDDGNYKVNGQKVMIPFIYKSTDNMMIQMLRQLDAPYSDSSGNIEIFNDTTKDILYDLADLAQKGAFSTFKISSYPANFLNAGQCIFAIDSTAGSTWMGSDAPLIDIAEENLVDFETVVMDLPQYDTADPKMISQGPSICLFNKEDSQEVLASWLFAQFLLTDEVQFSYCKTEGYIPASKKTLESKEYQDYLNNSGIDNNEHYYVKIEASKSLINNIDNTFVTEVFNGSASLRQAAGQLIEETVKAVNRNKTIDDEFFDNLYSNIKSLYKLDQTSSSALSRDLGPLPVGSKVLIGTLAVTWVCIGVYYFKFMRKK